MPRVEVQEIRTYWWAEAALRSSLTGMGLLTPDDGEVTEGQFLEMSSGWVVDGEADSYVEWFGQGTEWRVVHHEGSGLLIRCSRPRRLPHPPFTVAVRARPKGSRHLAHMTDEELRLGGYSCVWVARALGWLEGEVELSERVRAPRSRHDSWAPRGKIPGWHPLVEMLMSAPAVAADWIEDNGAGLGLGPEEALSLAAAFRGESYTPSRSKPRRKRRST